MPIAITDRLFIAELTAADAPFILQLVNSPGWLEFIGDRGIKTTADAESYIANGPVTSYKTNGFGLYRVALQGGNLSIGICGFVKRDILPNPDLGFAFLPEYTGNGYALEAATALLVFARQVLKLEKILAITLEKNLRSIRLLHKLGFVFEKKVQLSQAGEELMLFGTN